MKKIRIFSLLAICMTIANFSFAQTVKTEKFKVSGNCGMCKTTIEKAAKDAGATSAMWDADSKELTVKYKSTSTNTAKIQQKIAGAGYDNAGFKATEIAYKKLHGCCQYDRDADTKKDACCAAGTECKEDHGKAHDAATPDCCKDGKCSKEGHTGPDCCKKS